jgi:Ca2+/Na+ antiporter
MDGLFYGDCRIIFEILLVDILFILIFLILFFEFLINYFEINSKLSFSLCNFLILFYYG